MKRIMQIIANLTIGGAEKVAADIALCSPGNAYEFHYIVFGDKIGEFETELTQKGHKVFHLPPPSENYSSFYKLLKRMMKQYKYDAVHAHTMFNAGWAMLAAKHSGVSIRIAHAHSALNDGTSIKKRIYEEVMRKLILQNATHLVSCGDAAGIRLFGEAEYRRSGICILNGIDTTAFVFDSEKRQAIRHSLDSEESFIIGHVGHLSSVKNQSFLICLMPEILKRKPNAKLLMLGEGEDRPVLEQLIQEHGLNDRVIMTGNVRNVSDYLSAMDVFAFPSLFEGMPLSIIEVQANGLPCMLSDRVPSDIFLTDLLQRISLEEPKKWIEFICSAKRKNSEKYSEELKLSGFDTETVMRKFYNIYEGVNLP